MRKPAVKKGNGQGSVQQLPSGRWRWQVTLGRDANGKLARRGGVANTKTAATRALGQVLADFQRGQLARPADVTLGEWLDGWLARRKSLVAETTFEQYAIRLRVYVPEGLKRLRLQDVKRSHLRDLEGQLAARNLAASVRSKVLSHLRAAFEEAIDAELLVNNPARGIQVKATVAEQLKRKPKALSDDELLRFLRAARGDAQFPAFYTLFSLGLRRGEALGLRWEDVDFDARTVRVVQQVKLVGNVPVIGALKTVSSRRQLTMSEDLRAVLLARREAQESDRELCGPAWVESGLVFTSAVGTVVHPRNFNRSIYRICREAGVRQFGSHAGRHTNLTNRLRLGEKLEVVSAIAGHASTSITLDVYRHVLEDEKRASRYSLLDHLRLEETAGIEAEGADGAA